MLLIRTISYIGHVYSASKTLFFMQNLIEVPLVIKLVLIEHSLSLSLSLSWFHLKLLAASPVGANLLRPLAEC